MNILQKLSEITLLRETKGKEVETLKLISELESQPIDLTLQVKLCWEKAFIYQHLVMSQIDLKTNLKLMAESALKAHKLIEQNDLTELQGDDCRFLGRVADYNEKYLDAYNYYQQAVDFYRPRNNFRVLEIEGFLSANLINQGKVDEGLAIARSVYSEFDQSPLKQSDNYTWVVWKTGIFPRVVEALLKQNVEFNREEIKKYLLDSLKLSSNQFRQDEINQALSMLQ